MNKKAFTLVELVACIIILGLISILALPPILNQIRGTREELEKTNEKVIFSAAELFLSDQQKFYPKINNNVYCLTLQDLVDRKLLNNPVVDAISGKELDLNSKIEARVYDYNYHYAINNDCVQKISPNEPDLLDKMVPIKYNGTNWVYADINQQWYDYDNKEWANAVILNSGVTKTVGQTISESEIALWYVWIPRYKYQLFNANNGSVNEQVINVTFESGTGTTGTVKCNDIDFTINPTSTVSETCTNAINGNWYTHPAFTFGNQELTGFWMGKFELSTTNETCNTTSNVDNCNKVSTVTIKPTVNSWRYTNVSNFYTSIQNISSDYSLTNVDSHMIKNMEWGAVAYLKQSKYGLGLTDIGINNHNNGVSDRKTGCGAIAGSSSSTECNPYNTANGMLASTTGNIYGVYDMSGGAYEYTMSNMVDSAGAFYPSSSGFTTTPEAKYYDRYTYDASSNITHARGKLGDATKETLKTFGNSYGGWYDDYANFPSSTRPWFLRGGSLSYGDRAGVFSFNHFTGTTNASLSSRAVIVKK